MERVRGGPVVALDGFDEQQDVDSIQLAVALHVGRQRIGTLGGSALGGTE